MYEGYEQINDPLYKSLRTITPVYINIPDTSNDKFVKNILFGKNSEFNRTLDKVD